MHWLWGILLGVALTCALRAVQFLVEAVHLADARESLLYACTLLVLALLSVLLFKRTPVLPQREIRLVREAEDEEKP